MVTAKTMARVPAPAASALVRSPQNVLLSSPFLPPTVGEKPLSVPLVDGKQLELEKKTKLGGDLGLTHLDASVSFSPPSHSLALTLSSSSPEHEKKISSCAKQEMNGEEGKGIMESEETHISPA